jgi:site-specific DNA-methyltransferase (adenine-specific)
MPAEVELRLGDYLGVEGLPALAGGSIDVAITDPPFDARTHRAALEGPSNRRGRSVAGALPFGPLADAELEEVAHQLARVTRRWIVVFSAERHLEAWARALELAGAAVVRFGLALRTNPRPQMTGDRPAPPADHLVIAHGPDIPLRWNGGGHSAVWPSPPARFDEGGQLHPTQKPLALIRALLEDFSDPDELVLDPFAGSGTTAVACRELGRRFLGWEISPEYHATAVRRIGMTREQLRLPAADAPEQLALGEAR